MVGAAAGGVREPGGVCPGKCPLDTGCSWCGPPPAPRQCPAGIVPLLPHGPSARDTLPLRRSSNVASPEGLRERSLRRPVQRVSMCVSCGAAASTCGGCSPGCPPAGRQAPGGGSWDSRSLQAPSCPGGASVDAQRLSRCPGLGRWHVPSGEPRLQWGRAGGGGRAGPSAAAPAASAASATGFGSERAARTGSRGRLGLRLSPAASPGRECPARTTPVHEARTEAGAARHGTRVPAHGHTQTSARPPPHLRLHARQP